MNRLYLTIFAFILLLGQWGSFDHAYHQHDTGEVCDYCLSAQALDHAIVPAIQFVFTPSFEEFQPDLTKQHTSSSRVRYYAARAPPRFL